MKITELARETLARIRAYADPATFIALVPEAEVMRAAAALEALAPELQARLPLLGTTFAVKDNIDVAGMPTTAGAPAFAYDPQSSATVFARLSEAGALFIGKTNLDQFATGLVGTRSPYGTPRNPFDAAMIPGGSSSGSAVAVGAGLVDFALGTDTAGSGRIPAGFTETIGLKPTRGLLSTAGVVPACRSLDCVSIFTRELGLAERVFTVAAAFDVRDPLSRERRAASIPMPARIALPRAEQLDFDGDEEARALFARAVERLGALGACEPVDIAPMLEAANLLYGDAFIAERTAAVGDFVAAHPDDTHPVTRAIIESGRRYCGVDVFRAHERLDRLRARVRSFWDRHDVLVVPTAPRAYSCAEIAREPNRLNARLGTYTNFVNFFDWSALAIPSTRTANDFPVGITLIGPAFAEGRLLALADAYAATYPPLGRPAQSHRAVVASRD